MTKARILTALLPVALVFIACDREDSLSPEQQGIAEVRLNSDGSTTPVVIIGGTVLDASQWCYSNYDAANVMGHTYGGCVPVAYWPELGAFSFAAMHPSAVSAASLAPYDIAVLNVASRAMACNTATLSSQAKTDLIAFVGGGKKLIIMDSECSPGWTAPPGPLDYSWLPYPFTTANPGPYGQTGTLTIVEDNTLSSPTVGDPEYIDAAYLGSNTDAVGDMNVMTTYDPYWCVDMSGTNYLNVTGPTHTYAKYPAGTDQGLIIYNGLDENYQWGYGGGIGASWLRKIWVLELQHSVNPSNLPCGYTVVGITMTPATAENYAGTSHTVTATLSDLLGNPQPGIDVTFSVNSGPNAGTSGTATTDANGEASFTYTGSGGVGTDEIQACFTDQAGNLLCSQTVATWWVYMPVDIDIKPYSDPNSINPKSGGVVAVAIMGSDVFDVTDVDVTTLVFGPGEAMPAHDLSDPYTYNDHLQDVYYDGYMDLVSHYRQKDTGLEFGDTEACILGATTSGILFKGCDAVRVLDR